MFIDLQQGHEYSLFFAQCVPWVPEVFSRWGRQNWAAKPRRRVAKRREKYLRHQQITTSLPCQRQFEFLWLTSAVRVYFRDTAFRFYPRGVNKRVIFTNHWPFLLREIFTFPFVSLWKSYFFTPNQYLSLDFVCSKTKLPNWPKSECKLWKFTTVQVRIMGKGFSATKNTDRKPPITAN